MHISVLLSGYICGEVWSEHHSQNLILSFNNEDTMYLDTLVIKYSEEWWCFFLLLYHLNRQTLFLLFNFVLFMGEMEEWSLCRSFFWKLIFFKCNLTSFLQNKVYKILFIFLFSLNIDSFIQCIPITIYSPSLSSSPIQPPPFPTVTPPLSLLQIRAGLPLTTTKRTKQETIRQGKSPHI